MFDLSSTVSLLVFAYGILHTAGECSSTGECGQESTSTSMPHLVIHAGPHKTGTTFIQHKLFKCAGWLRDAYKVEALVPLKPSRNSRDNDNSTRQEIVNHNFGLIMHERVINESWGKDHAFYSRFHDEELYNMTWAQIRDCEERKCTAVISTEIFASWTLPTWEYFLRRLGGWRITVVLFFRSAGPLIRSELAEHSKSIYETSKALSLYEVIMNYIKKDSQLSLLRTVTAAFRSSCIQYGSVEGVVECSVFGASFDQLIAEEADLFAVVAINATLGLRDKAWSRAVESYRADNCSIVNKTMGRRSRTVNESRAIFRKKRKADLLAVNESRANFRKKKADAMAVNKSPPNIIIKSSIMRILVGMHYNTGCEEHLRMTANHPRIDNLIRIVNFPTICFDMGEMLEWRTHAWFNEIKVAVPKAALESEEFCDIAESKLKSGHRDAISWLLPPSCRDEYAMKRR